MKLTIMTYNICSGRNLSGDRNMAHAAEIVNQVQPAFAAVNEVCFNTSYAPEAQADALGRLTGYYPVFGRSIDIAGGGYGNAFITRCPLLESGVVHIPDRKDETSDRFEHRSVLRSVVDVRGRRITVLSTHFGLSVPEQESAVETVLSILAKEKNPVILMGDLNLTPESAVLDPLFDVFTDTAGRAGDILTFPSDEPRIKIDYIMHSAGIRTLSVKSMDTQNSDHRPLIAEIEVE